MYYIYELLNQYNLYFAEMMDFAINSYVKYKDIKELKEKGKIITYFNYPEEREDKLVATFVFKEKPIFDMRLNLEYAKNNSVIKYRIELIEDK